MFGIRIDANQDIGMGHFSRCRCVADELLRRGFRVVFICSKDTDVSVFEGFQYKYYIVEDSFCKNWNLNSETRVIDELSLSTILVDSYYVSIEYFNSIRKKTKVIMLDDLNMFAYNVDAVINFNIEANKEMYSDAHIIDRKVFLGLEYFPLREDLRIYKSQRNLKENIESVLISSGGTDPKCCIDNILESLDVISFPNVKFKVLIGNFFIPKYIDYLKKRYSLNNVEFLTWGQNMGKLYTSVDLLVAPGSMFTYEALSLGTPCITYEFAKNQHFECVALDEKGIADYAGICSKGNVIEFRNNINKCFLEYQSIQYREDRIRIISNLLDGRGGERIADIMIGVNNGKEI